MRSRSEHDERQGQQQSDPLAAAVNRITEGQDRCAEVGVSELLVASGSWQLLGPVERRQARVQVFVGHDWAEDVRHEVA
jgi:hypothetical protein